MSSFIESLTKIKEDFFFFSGLHTFGKFINELNELCLAGPLLPEPMLQFRENVLFCEMFGNTRSLDMLRHFTEDTGQGYWLIVGWFGLVPFLKNRGYIGLFLDKWESPCIEGFLEDQF